MKFNLDLLNKIYITSDTHAFHVNLTRGTTAWSADRQGDADNKRVRDFDTPFEMTQKVADNFNAIIPEDGILIHLGDWSFAGKQNISIFREMLNVKELHLVTGNHDTYIRSGFYDHLFTSRQADLMMYVGSMMFHLYHHPIDSWDGLGRGSYHLHGHQHFTGDKRFGNGRKMDVGVDGNDLKPYRLSEVVNLLKDRVHVSEGDHHV
tara:strand:+ start:4233 stop:4850 length:618 start_codon:yes stop_codon:yes gene_type:complete